MSTRIGANRNAVSLPAGTFGTMVGMKIALLGAMGFVGQVAARELAGRPEIRTLADKWTVVTADGSLSAHFEHTVVIDAGGPRPITVAPVTAST